MIVAGNFGITALAPHVLHEMTRPTTIFIIQNSVEQHYHGFPGSRASFTSILREDKEGLKFRPHRLTRQNFRKIDSSLLLYLVNFLIKYQLPVD